MNVQNAVERQGAFGSAVPPYLPMMVFLAFVAFLLTGFGTGLGVWQPIPVYVFLCLTLLTLQEHIARNRSLAHRTYVFLASSFAVLYAGEVFFALKQLDFTHAPMTYIVTEAVLLVAFLADTASRHRARSQPAALSARYGDWAIDAMGLAVFFYASAFLLDLLGSQTVLQPLRVRIGQPPYVAVDLNALFHLHLASPVNTLEGLNLVLGLGTMALALALLTIAGVVLPSTENSGAYIDGVRSLYQVSQEGVGQMIASLRLVAGPLIWLIPAFSVAAFADHVSQYFNASAHTPSSLWDLFNPLSPTSRDNIGLGLNTLLLGLLAVAAMIAAVAILETSTDVFRRALATLRDAGRAITLTSALFLYSLATINAVSILLGVTKIAPFQVGSPGLLAVLLGFGFLLYESARIERAPAPTPLPRTAPLTAPRATAADTTLQPPRTPVGTAN